MQMIHAEGEENTFRVAGNYANRATAIVGNFKIPSGDNKQDPSSSLNLRHRLSPRFVLAASPVQCGPPLNEIIITYKTPFERGIYVGRAVEIAETSQRVQ